MRPIRAAVEQRPRVEDGRVLEVVVSHQGAHPGARRRVRHLLGLAEGHPHRLLAVDVLAGRDRSQRHLVVQGVRGGDGDQIDRRVLHEGAPVVRRPGETELRRRILRLRERYVAEHLQQRARHVAEDGLHRAEGEGVALAHEARADQSDPDAVHRILPVPESRFSVVCALACIRGAPLRRPGWSWPRCPRPRAPSGRLSRPQPRPRGSPTG